MTTGVVVVCDPSVRRHRTCMQTSWCPSTAPASSPLLLLPTPLFHLVLTFLPLPCKFLSVTRLSRRFPSLTPSAFQYDHLDLSADTLSELSSIRRRRKTALLAQVRSLALFRRTNHDESDVQLCHFISDFLGVAQPFSALRILHLCVPDASSCSSARDSNAVIAGLHTFAASLPHLHTLGFASSFIAEPGDTDRLASDVLARLPSLRHLALACFVEVSAVQRLLSLPLLSLNLREAYLYGVVPTADDPCPTLESANSLLRRLWLPRTNNKQHLVYLAQAMQAYAEDLAARHQSALEVKHEAQEGQIAALKQSVDSWQLQYLYCPSEILQPFATAIPSLTSLYVCSNAKPADLRSFLSTTSPACLPYLTSLTFRVADNDTFGYAINELCSAFHSSLASQLQHLRLVANLGSARAFRRLLDSIMTCTKLLSLHFTATVSAGHSLALPAHVWRLPSLRRLSFSVASRSSASDTHSQHDDVVRLLEACPALHDLCLSRCHVSVNLLPAIARSCRQLRALRIRSVDPKLWVAREELLSAAATEAHFRSLHTLDVDFHYSAGKGVPHHSALLLPSLSSLLRHAPIRHLCFLPHMDKSHVHFLAHFSQLARLRLRDSHLSLSLAPFCHPPESRRLSFRTEVVKRADYMAEWVQRATLQQDGSDGDWAVDEEGWEGQLWSHSGHRAAAVEWGDCPRFITERLFARLDGQLLTGREAWLERCLGVAVAETGRRRLEA